jgi:hypothetical protein
MADTHDILLIAVSFGGIPFTQGAGDNAFINVVAPTQMGAVTGAQGDLVFHRTPDNAYTVTLSLLGTSSNNALLQAARQAQRLPGGGASTMVIANTSSGQILEGDATISKEPDVNWGPETPTYEWTILLESKVGWRTQAASPAVP